MSSISIFPFKSPIECAYVGEQNATQYWGVELVGTSKFLHPDVNEFIEWGIYKFKSKEEAEAAIDAYFEHGPHGAL